jgi:hypothetical protein
MPETTNGTWVPGADGSGFGIENLPYGFVRRGDGPARPAVRVARDRGRRLRRLLRLHRARLEPRAHVPAQQRTADAELAPRADRLPRPAHGSARPRVAPDVFESGRLARLELCASPGPEIGAAHTANRLLAILPRLSVINL